jgi:hypothetical protein
MKWSMTKGELLTQFLEERGVRLHVRAGWQKISCVNDAAHPRGDRNPSASVNLTEGKYKCFACDMGGDVYDLLKVLENLDFVTARATLGGEATTQKEETWL